MQTWLRKLRGILGMGAIWGFAGTALGLAIVGVRSIFGTMPPYPVFGVFGWSLQLGFELFAVGSGFAAVLTVMDGHKTFEELTPGRAARWGAVAGGTVLPIVGCLIVIALGLGSELTLPVLIQMGLLGVPLCAVMTAGLAAGTVALAKRAPAELGAGTERYDSLPPGDPGEARMLQPGSG